MIKIGITGQAGFIGSHLFNTLSLDREKYIVIPFEDNYFDNETALREFVKQCDAIVHLAAMNRHTDPQVIYDTNIHLVNRIISTCEYTGAKPHILFSSSTQEEKDNLYGKSKKEGRKLFENWALKNNASFSGLVIPNVFGPFGKPYYNSVVATFCYQLTHNETPRIDVDNEINLIYVSQLVNHFIKTINRVNELKKKEGLIEEIFIDPAYTAKVSQILEVLESFRENYLNKGEIPSLSDDLQRDLFNTFVCFIKHDEFFPFKLKLNTDDRGSFVETVRLNSGGQISFSTTKPGITRGNHFHTRKAERFAVIKGKAKIELRRIGTGEVLSFELNGDEPSFVDMPVWYTHNITNIGNDELYTVFWISEHFDANDPDTFFEKV